MSSLVCRVCNSHQVKIHHFKEMMMQTYAPFDYLECFDCGSVVIKDFPKDMSSYYGGQYYSMQSLEPSHTKRKRFKKITQKLEKQISGADSDSTFEYFAYGKLSLQTQQKILDVGCGSGHLLYHLKELGFKHVQGIDPFLAKDIHYPNELHIYKKGIDEVQEKFDVILFNHSLEHVENPAKILETAKDLLLPGGKIVVRIPIIGYCWHVYREYWFGLDAPRHFFLFSKKGLELTANKVGLKLADTIFDCTLAHIISSEMYKSRSENNKEKSYPPLLKRIMKKWTYFKYQTVLNELNKQGFSDQAAFVLTKD
jgi:SAM-dependent methyltransferase